jgi:LytS/YehU family sensor histidine kinase
MGIMAALATAVLLNDIAFDYLADVLFPGYYLISNFAWWEVALVIAIYMLITTLLKLSYAWFELERARRKLALIEKENMHSELRMLKAQMNPHFLFNSLNAIYALAMKESEKTPDAIIQLADILRYVIYQSNQDRVALKDEVKLISDYIELQKLRTDSSSTITFVHQLQNEYAEIAPLLLLPLVENSFKHGVNADLVNTYVDIDLQATDAEAVFQISNSKVAAERRGHAAGTDMADKQNGMGNDNIRQRLNLLYPGRHSLDIQETEDRYRVKLILNL